MLRSESKIEVLEVVMQGTDLDRSWECLRDTASVRTPRDFREACERRGFDRDLQDLILPDWWSEDCEEQADLLPELEVRVARVMGMTITEMYDFLTDDVQAA